MDIVVTCIYNKLSNTIYGGRTNRHVRYQTSLIAIARTGVRVICFTSSDDYQELVGVFLGHNLNNVEFRILELSDLPFHKRIQEIKSKYPEKFSSIFWQHRSAEVMWGKMFMMAQVAREYPDIENMFWMDAGLCHNDTLSPKFSLQSDINSGITENAQLLMTPQFFPSLHKWLDGKLLAIESTTPHNAAIPQKYNHVPYRNSHGMVGGFFGGNVGMMVSLIPRFFEKVDAILADDELYGEENIFPALISESPEMFKSFVFDSWYHEGWGERYNPKLVTFSNFFDELMRYYGNE